MISCIQLSILASLMTLAFSLTAFGQSCGPAVNGEPSDVPSLVASLRAARPNMAFDTRVRIQTKSSFEYQPLKITFEIRETYSLEVDNENQLLVKKRVDFVESSWAAEATFNRGMLAHAVAQGHNPSESEIAKLAAEIERTIAEPQGEEKTALARQFARRTLDDKAVKAMKIQLAMPDFVKLNAVERLLSDDGQLLHNWREYHLFAVIADYNTMQVSLGVDPLAKLAAATDALSEKDLLGVAIERFTKGPFRGEVISTHGPYTNIYSDQRLTIELPKDSAATTTKILKALQTFFLDLK